MNLHWSKRSENMKEEIRLRKKCPNCGYWNRIEVNKIFVEQETSEPKVKAFIPMYKPLKIEKCKKCGKVIAEPRELIRIVKENECNSNRPLEEQQKE